MAVQKKKGEWVLEALQACNGNATVQELVVWLRAKEPGISWTASSVCSAFGTAFLLQKARCTNFTEASADPAQRIYQLHSVSVRSSRS